MQRVAGGYWEKSVPGVGAGALYKYVIDGAHEHPDPASAYQPQGVYGPSEVIDHAAFKWEDAAWQGISPDKMIIYELHPGTFTSAGGFAGVEGKLSYLKDLGITALELMPVAQFPGSRNWGYDGVFPYAAQDSYGGPQALKQLVNACHCAGLAVILDVVYNHLGPAGNCLECFGPYFTERYHTPWGKAVNFDGPDCGPVRDYFIGNALYWFEHFHIDALRLDAVHAIFDFGAKHLLAELAERVRVFSASGGRARYLIAESDLNDPRVIKSGREGGLGLDAQWSDDFHHALHAFLTGERAGYYADFGGFPALVKAFCEGFVYDWAWSEYRKRMHGAPAATLAPRKFVVCAQNHDQVGNRSHGERLPNLTDLRHLKLAAGALLLSPYIPLLFMGEEYAETNPFRYFVSHGDEQFIAAFLSSGSAADPRSEELFDQSHLDWNKPQCGRHAEMLEFYRKLIALRKAHPSLGVVARSELEVSASAADLTLSLSRRRGHGATLTSFNFGCSPVATRLPPGLWQQIFDSISPAAAARPAARVKLEPQSFKVFRRSSP